MLYSPAIAPQRQTPIRSIVLVPVAGFANQAQVRVMDSLQLQVAADLHTTVGVAAARCASRCHAFAREILAWLY